MRTMRGWPSKTVPDSTFRPPRASMATVSRLLYPEVSSSLDTLTWMPRSAATRRAFTRFTRSAVTGSRRPPSTARARISGSRSAMAPATVTSTLATFSGSSCTMNRPRRSARVTNGRSAATSPGSPTGMLTANSTSSPSRKATSWRATSTATFTWASVEFAPRWGVTTTRGCWISAVTGALVGGSSLHTSMAAPATCPASSAARRSPSWMIPPRAQFTSRTPRLVRASSAAATMCSVSDVRGTWTVMTSDSPSRVSKSVSCAPTSRARASGMYGSYASTVASKARRRAATREPTLPSPTTPTVLRASSLPWMPRFHSAA